MKWDLELNNANNGTLSHDFSFLFCFFLRFANEGGLVFFRHLFGYRIKGLRTKGGLEWKCSGYTLQETVAGVFFIKRDKALSDFQNLGLT